MEQRYDALIVGAGIIGCCIAFELSKKGYKTINVDIQTTAKGKIPISDFHSFYPPRRPDDLRFLDEPTGMVVGACYTPESGYVADPTLATQNVEAAVKAKGGTFLYKRKVIEIRQDAERVVGVSLDDAGVRQIQSNTSQSTSCLHGDR